jgi:geranylgeranyl pyrophosphate synthase
VAQQETSTPGAQREWVDFAWPVKEELAAVEKILNEVVSRDVPVVREIYHQMLRGGKRLRPTLMLLSAASFRPLTPGDHALYRAAAAVELVHLASLLHDDLVDKSATRRGKPSIQSQYGVEAAVLTGDYIAAMAYRRLSLQGRPRALSRLASAVASMCEAELVVLSRRDSMLDLRAYLAVAAGKTGSLMSAACEIGAMEGGADLLNTQLLGAFGRDLGIAFQIADDLLDLYGEPGQTGKPRGKDLTSNQPNLPVILALQGDAHGRLRQLLERLRASGEQSEEAIAEAAALVERLGGRAEARKLAEQYALSASERLTQVPEGPAREALLAACHYVVRRAK